MSRTAPRIITGRHYTKGAPRFVTGWPTKVPNLNGKAADTLVPVTVLTDNGEVVRDVLVRAIDVVGVTVRDFRGFTERMLWRIVEKNMSGCAELAFAELGRREREEIKERVRQESARLEASRRAADALMGRV